MSDNPCQDKTVQPDAKLHKGYLWALAVVLVVGGWVYFSSETRNLDGKQKFYFWALEERYPQPIKDLAGKHTLEQLEGLCRAASEAQSAQADSPLFQSSQRGRERG